MKEIYVSDLICAGDSYEDTKKFFEDNKIENLEFFIEPSDKEHTIKLEMLLKNLKIKSASFHGPYRYFTLTASEKEWTYMKKDFEYAVDLAHNNRGEFIVLHTNEVLNNDNRDKIKEIVEERIESLIGYAQSKGIKTVVENVGVKGNMLYSEEEYISLIKENNFYSLIDIGHAVINRWDIPKVIEELKERIIGYHLHNNDGEKDQHLPISQGKYDFSSILKIIKEKTPKANLVLEYSAVTLKEKLIEDLKNLDF